MTQIQRRQFIASLGAAATALAMPNSALAGHHEKLKKIGVQLYTVRNLMAESVEKTIKGIAALGFDEVETAGYFGKSAKDFSMILKDNGLTAPSAHMDVNLFIKDPYSFVDYAAEVGHDYVVLAWLPPQLRTLDGYKGVFEKLNKVAERTKAAGMQMLYHNHEFEFETVDGVVPYEMLLESTDSDLVQLELDLYWCAVAGVDPLEYINRYPGRVPAVHVKDRSADNQMVSVGKGTIDFKTVFQASKKAGLKHYFVEHDNPSDAMASIASSIKHLRNLTF
ncbi:sugar phosphate isomerase/epimerase [Temperatibacter marinus]|uniref:Sugar phosphate isomerase/epimerase n=1 Tax=Temperatibacter marinus TaxID=1456591 RepID=A0AA52EDD2_9PROT|nr:sugar phosphate isomerase/epimerase [Temperatibacter marinus]WND02701.1 sugar phosphate isomerase/epimerase [Temperatibacter marinus]